MADPEARDRAAPHEGPPAKPFSDAVAALYRVRFPSLFRFLDRLTGDADLAEDIAQDTFVRLQRRGVMPDDPPAWLAAVASNLFRDQRRQTSRRAELVAHHVADADGPLSPEAVLIAQETRDRVRAALDSMSDRDRRLLLLRHEGYSYRELAAIIGVAEGSIGTLLVRATRTFRQAIDVSRPEAPCI